jgi:hypothetical protein
MASTPASTTFQPTDRGPMASTDDVDQAPMAAAINRVK